MEERQSKRTLWKTALLGALRTLGEVKNCPQCKGSGLPFGEWTTVYWRGRTVNVCANCEGSGKVPKYDLPNVAAIRGAIHPAPTNG